MLSLRSRCLIEMMNRDKKTFAVVNSKTRWIALLGRKDEPTDGVEDYCVFLGRALATQGVVLTKVRVDWNENGWISAFRKLSRECTDWRADWVILQYTAMAWSRRGFPFAILIALYILRRHDIRIAVVFHEARRQGGSRWIDHVRGACQDWVVERLCERASMSIFTVPLETIEWLPKAAHGRAAFIPIGANVPACENRRSSPSLADHPKTVIVFGVTGKPNTEHEIEEIASVLREASNALRHLRLVVVGRGSTEAREPLERALGQSKVDLVVRGILPAEDVARQFEAADALLFVRGVVTLQRGSAIAGIACGLPIVGYRSGEINDPLKEAGVEWASWNDRAGLVRGLVRILSDPARWIELHERNLDLQKSTLSWSRIADRYRTALAE
jgi:glycosyltransferase involved in cell wall biosynthesis